MPEQRHKGSGTLREVRSGVDGATSINESTFVTDEQVLDHYGPLAVQIPEDSGADGSYISMGLADALEEGHVEGKFGTSAAPVPVHPDPDSLEDSSGVRAAGDDSGDDFEPDHDTVVGPDYHKEPAVLRDAREADDAEDRPDPEKSRQLEAQPPDATKTAGDDRVANASTPTDTPEDRK